MSWRKEAENELANGIDYAAAIRNVVSQGLRSVSSLARISLGRTRREVARSHPMLFGRVYFPEWMPHESPEFHREMVDLTLESSRTAFAAPRGFAKTTLMTKILSSFMAFEDERCKEILLLSASGDMASTWLSQIKTSLESNTEIQEDFGDVRGVHWGDSDLEVLVGSGGRRKRVWMRARGRGCQVRGMRPFLVVVDDLDNEETLNSQKMQSDLWEWYWGALVNVLDRPEKKLVNVGTAISPEALIVRLIADPKPGWVCRSYEALKNGKSIWEAWWPTEHLLQRQAEIGVAKFAAEFLNAPIGRSGRAFTHRHIVYDSERLPEKAEDRGYVTMTVDPAASGLGDPWAIVVVNQTRDGIWKVVEAVNESSPMDRMIEAIFRFQGVYHPRIVGVETSAFQHSLKYVLEDQSRRRNVHLPILCIHNTTRKTKHQRIMELMPLFEAGRILLQHSQSYLRDEILGYPRGTDDLLDALAMQLEVQRAPRVERAAPERPKGMSMAELRAWGKRDKQPSGRWDRFLPTEDIHA